MRPLSIWLFLLSKFFFFQAEDGIRDDLSTNQYSGAVYPQGYSYLEGFRLDPFPIFTFEVDGVRIEKSLFMVHGQNTTVIQYRFSAEETRPIQLELRPLIGFRDYHALTHENDALERSVHLHDEKLASVQPYPDHPVLYFAHDAYDLNTQGYWYKNFDYALERERGLDFVEDLFNPLTL